MMEKPRECHVPNFCENFRKLPLSHEFVTSEQQLALLNLSVSVGDERAWIYYCAGSNEGVCPIKPWMFSLLTGEERTILQPSIDPK